MLLACRLLLPRPSALFRPLDGIGLRSNAAQSLAVHVDSSGRLLLAVASFYGGETQLFELNTGRPRLEPRLLQSLSSAAAHDVELFTLQDGRLQLFVSEFEANSSAAWELGAESLRACYDAQAGCSGWAAAGECDKNAAFMHAACARACAACPPRSGPLGAVQEVPGRGCSAARHFVHDGRDFLATACTREEESVAVYEWRSGRWMLLGRAAVQGVAEVAYCPSNERKALLVLPTWHARGSFSSDSYVYEFLPDAAQPLVARQRLRSSGAHDAECWLEAASGATMLVIANARDDDGRRDVPSSLYRLGADGFFVHVQALPTLGAHDAEVLTTGSATMVLVASQGDGVDCSTGKVDVFVVKRDGLQRTQTLSVPCPVFVRCTSAGGRTLLFVAVEREGAEPDVAASYATHVRVFELA